MGYKMYIWFKDLKLKDIRKHSTKGQEMFFGVGSHRHSYIYQCSGFDIETTQVITKDYAHAYMYIWSFTYNDLSILGSYWEEFIELLEMFIKYFQLGDGRRMMVFIANESFEFQFMRKWLHVTDSFFIEDRKPLYVIHKDSIEFRDALQISGGKLADLARNYTKTQKMVGDLDYSILRNHKDGQNLKPKELKYVLKDTIILSEYMRYYFDTFAPQGFLPLTKTGILRHEVKQEAKKACKAAGKQLTNLMQASHPQERLYELMMKYLFRGGYVHGAGRYSGLVLEDMAGIDITSSYPNEMFTKDNYPMSNFYRVNNLSIEHYEELNKEYATMAVINFYDIDVTGAHSLESLNKIIKKEGAHIDNGRIIDAKMIQVFLTDVDYSLYKKFYKWSKMEIKHLWRAVRGTLPRYLLDTLNKYYEKKASLKRAGKNKTVEYHLSKEMVNAGYGLCVTRMRQNTITYDSESEDYVISDNFVFRKEVSKQSLLPQWGIWITANARASLLNLVYEIDQESTSGCDAVYMDTDSIKILNYEEHKKTIDNYNSYQDIKIQEVCKKYNYNYQNMKGLGSFDLEYPYIKRFKHNGAKRYAMKYYDFKTKEYKIESTIAGLTKGALVAYCNRTHKSVWEVFVDGMNIPIIETGKLASVYNDNPHSDIINGELMEEKSSICLTPIEFTMSIDANYRLYINEIQKRLELKFK